MLRFFAIQSFLGVIAAVLLTACGGGGDGSPAKVVISSSVPADGTTGVAYTGFTFSASGGSGTYSWTETGALPPGLSFSSAGALSGTPVTAGSFSFTVTVTDSSNSSLMDSKPFSIKIADSLIVISTSPAPPTGLLTHPYPGFAFTATGGSPPFTWTVKAGALPAGLTLNADGSITGTVSSTAMSSTFTVLATDSAMTPQSASQPFTVMVTDPGPPVITLTPPPTATVGTPYSFQFTATAGLGPLVWSETGPLPGLVLSFGGTLSGTPSASGIFPITVNVKDALNRSAPGLSFTVRVSLARPTASFTATKGNMTVARAGHTATLLLSGEVLIAGGPDRSAELYDPKSEMFTSTGNMSVARSGHTATLIGGTVLMAGGGTQTAELYDVTSGMFTSTGSMLVMRKGQTATLLKTGKVLIAGGGTASAELYDPSSGTFTLTGSMSVARTDATATLLLSGAVLIAGGGSASAELYNAASGTFSATGSMSEVRTGHTATLLADGSVLIVGPDVTAELYNAASGKFAPVGNLPLTNVLNVAEGVTGSTATLRNDGTVLVAGGDTEFLCGPFCGHLKFVVSRADAELFAPEIEGFIATGSLLTPRDRHTATLLGNGAVLVTGGVRDSVSCDQRCRASKTVLSSAELFK